MHRFIGDSRESQPRRMFRSQNDAMRSWAQA